MQSNTIHEKIKVAAVFDENNVLPKWFYWGRNKHLVQKVEHVWQSKEGETKILCFAVTDGVNVFEIRLSGALVTTGRDLGLQWGDLSTKII